MSTFIRADRFWTTRGDTVLETLGRGKYDVVREPTDSEEGKGVWVLIDGLSSGDYDNMGSVGRSNMRVFENEHAGLFDGDDDTADAVIVHSAFSHRAVAVRWEAYDHRSGSGDREELSEEEEERLERWDALADVVSALADYIVLDESDLSELECEEESEQWHDYAREDFRRELIKAHPEKEDAIDAASNETLGRLWYDACSESGYYPEHAGDEIHWHFDRVVPKVDVSSL